MAEVPQLFLLLLSLEGLVELSLLLFVKVWQHSQHLLCSSIRALERLDSLMGALHLLLSLLFRCLFLAGDPALSLFNLLQGLLIFSDDSQGTQDLLQIDLVLRFRRRSRSFCTRCMCLAIGHRFNLAVTGLIWGGEERVRSTLIVTHHVPSVDKSPVDP